MKWMQLSLAIGLMIVVGCGTTNSAGLRSERNVQAGKSIADGRLEVNSVELSTRGNDSPALLVEVKSRSGKEVRLEYQVRWFSKDKREFRRGAGEWSKLAVRGDQGVWISSLAPARWCVKYEINFREAH